MARFYLPESCDSWAWAFFQRIHAWPATDVLTLQAFDAERLTSLISDYAHRSKMHIHYLSAMNGKEILTNEIDSEQTDTEFNELAAHCRGNHEAFFLVLHALLIHNGDARLQCVADFYLHPQHDAKQVQALLEDVALTSPYIYFDDPVAVVVFEKPWGTVCPHAKRCPELMR